MLQVKNIGKEFGGLKALEGIDFEVKENEIVSIIGPNGAGKTTLFNLLSGIYKADQGEMLFKGKPLNSLAGHRRASLGIARTFQNIRLFPNMTALENIMVGRHSRSASEIASALLRTPGFIKEEKDIIEKSRFYLNFVGLAGSANTLAKNLPYGLQRRIEIARALAAEPGLLLLDEPSAGMNAKESDELMRLIRKIRSSQVTILLIEHHIRLVMAISDKVIVLDYGKKIAEGLPQEIKNNRLVIEAYLGKAEF